MVYVWYVCFSCTCHFLSRVHVFLFLIGFMSNHLNVHLNILLPETKEGACGHYCSVKAAGFPVRRHWMQILGTLVEFRSQCPLGWLTIACITNCRGADALSWSFQAPAVTYVHHIDTETFTQFKIYFTIFSRDDSLGKCKNKDLKSTSRIHI